MAEVTRATLRWQEGLRFQARTESGFDVLTDSPSRPECQAASPMELVLVGVAGCMAMDVVSILLKMKQELASATVEIAGERHATHPKYYSAVSLTFRLAGRGLELEKAERAIELSRTTYCSAISSLRPDCVVTVAVELSEA